MTKIMMDMFDELAKEIPEFKEFLDHEFKNKKTEFIKSSQTKSISYSVESRQSSCLYLLK